MIEKIMFPLILCGKTTSGMFYTTEDITLEEQISTIKHLFPYVLEPIHKSLSKKEMSPSIYNFSIIKGIVIASIITPKHIIKLKFNGKDINFYIYQTSDNSRLVDYNVLDLLKHLGHNGEDSLIYLLNNDMSKENYNKILLHMFTIITELLFNKFFV